jgi:hypothetical protein
MNKPFQYIRHPNMPIDVIKTSLNFQDTKFCVHVVHEQELLFIEFDD